MLRQSLNTVDIKGKLEEVDLSIHQDKTGRDYIRGTVTILVDQVVDGKAEKSHVEVNVFQYPTTKKGTSNKAYESAKSLMDNGVSIAACGSEDGADIYSVSGANLANNTFTDRNGRDVTYTFIRGSFFNKATRAVTPCAEFNQEIVIAEMEDEIVKDEPTGRLIVKGIGIGYNENPENFIYYVESQQAIDYIKNYWQVEDTVQIAGVVRMKSELTEAQTEEVSMGFGAIRPKTYERTVKEYIITAGSAGRLPEEKCYDVDEVLKACNAKKAAYEASKGGRPAEPATKSRLSNRGF